MNKLFLAASAATLLVSGAAMAAPATATSVAIDVTGSVEEACALSTPDTTLEFDTLSTTTAETLDYEIEGSCNTQYTLNITSEYGALRHVPTISSAASANNSLVYTVAATGLVSASGTSADLDGAGFTTPTMSPLPSLTGSGTLEISYNPADVALLFAGSYTDTLTVTLTPVPF